MNIRTHYRDGLLWTKIRVQFVQKSQLCKTKWGLPSGCNDQALFTCPQQDMIHVSLQPVLPTYAHTLVYNSPGNMSSFHSNVRKKIPNPSERLPFVFEQFQNKTIDVCLSTDMWLQLWFRCVYSHCQIVACNESSPAHSLTPKRFVLASPSPCEASLDLAVWFYNQTPGAVPARRCPGSQNNHPAKNAFVNRSQFLFSFKIYQA